MSPVILSVETDACRDSGVSEALSVEQKYDVVTTDKKLSILSEIDSVEPDIVLFGFETGDEAVVQAIRDAHPLLPIILFTVVERHQCSSLLEIVTAHVLRSRDNALAAVAEAVDSVCAYIAGGAQSPRSATEILQQITDGFYSIDRDWRFTDVNTRAEALLGRTADELIGKNVWELFPKATETVLYDEYHAAMRTQQSAAFTFYYEPLETWFKVSVHPSNSELLVYFEDITDRMLQTMAMDRADIGIVIADPRKPSTPIVYVNRGFETLSGYNRSEAVGSPVEFLSGPLTDQRSNSQLRTAISDGESTTVEVLNYRRDGTPFWNQVQLTPVFDTDGSIVRIITFQYDITTRIETEQRIELLQRVLRHNIRNDVNVILGYLDLLVDREMIDAQQTAPIRRGATRILELSENARNLETLLEEISFEPTPISVVDLLEQAIDRVSEGAFDESVYIQSTGETTVLGSDGITLACTELIKNAIKHGREPYNELQIQVTDAKLNQAATNTAVDAARIEFHDRGPPLSNLDRATLLGKTETPIQHGSGIGLWVVHWLITMSGGEISYDVSPTGGNCITVTVPVAQARNSIAE
ncbi:PAS domain-containing protein [Natronocalculus amylovorans]|uniref:PAS domain-containing protein n=1 Tax=Natronocalculus amylovorans TaxID=2917812 RepID=A0AAE3KBG4_9EURY|nr:PAS domain-containing protein [Natronocalculus amylovorans]MCL9817394.1 PAS domain-containing protein [Natronocalculus amylovorans]